MRIVLYILAITLIIAWIIGSIRFQAGGLGYLILIIAGISAVMKLYNTAQNKKLREMNWPFV